MFTFNNKVTPINYLSEESQKSKIRFAFCATKNNSYYYNTTSWVKCRDFLNDVLFFQKHTTTTKENTSVNIYGFTYKATVDKSTDIIALISHDIQDLKNIKTSVIQILNKLEKQIYPTYEQTETYLDNEKYTNIPVLIVKPSPIWFTNTYTFSLFTCLLRLFTYEKLDKNIWRSIFLYNEKESTNDTYLVKMFEKKSDILNTILLNLTEIPDTSCEVSDDVYYIHEKLGIICGIYNPTVLSRINLLENKPCPQDVKDVILF